MASTEQEVEDRVAAAMEVHNMRQAASRLYEARGQIKNLRYLDLPDDTQDHLDRLVIAIEDSEWKIEQYLLAHGGKAIATGNRADGR